MRSSAPELIDDLFRREAVRIVALLAARVGAGRIDLVEDAVQDALLSAMKRWPHSGVPREPAAWLFTASRNALLDRLRRARFELPQDPTLLEAAAIHDEVLPEAFGDEALRLLVYCCHPRLALASQIALTLRLACGLSVAEIAHALHSTAENVTQRIVRAKRELRDAGVELTLPEDLELVEHSLPAILATLYLMFNAGYLAEGDADVEPIRPLLVREAVRLVELLLTHRPTARPETRALAALLHLAAARLPARRDAEGRLVELERQDRSRWDRRAIARGYALLDASLEGAVLTRWHVEAAIAAAHARAARFEDTDWREIVEHYDRLLGIAPGPSVVVSRAIALRHARGAQAGLRALAEAGAAAGSSPPREREGALTRAARAELLMAQGERDAALVELDAAIGLTLNLAVRDALMRRREAWRTARKEQAGGDRSPPAL